MSSHSSWMLAWLSWSNFSLVITTGRFTKTAAYRGSCDMP